MTNVKTNLEKSQQLQNLLKNFEARDRNIQENNFTRVNLLSGFQLIVMISVGLTQVLMIRSLFSDPKSAQTMRARTWHSQPVQSVNYAFYTMLNMLKAPWIEYVEYPLCWICWIPSVLNMLNAMFVEKATEVLSYQENVSGT